MRAPLVMTGKTARMADGLFALIREDLERSGGAAAPLILSGCPTEEEHAALPGKCWRLTMRHTAATHRTAVEGDALSSRGRAEHLRWCDPRCASKAATTIDTSDFAQRNRLTEEGEGRVPLRLRLCERGRDRVAGQGGSGIL